MYVDGKSDVKAAEWRPHHVLKVGGRVGGRQRGGEWGEARGEAQEEEGWRTERGE